MKYISYNATSFKKTHYYQNMPAAEQLSFAVLTTVFHFKINNYVLENLIDWDNIPNDPIYQLSFPRKQMLSALEYSQLSLLVEHDAPTEQIGDFVQQVKQRLYPELKQVDNCFITHEGKTLTGMYRNFDTIINLCPDPMVKTCHAYCSYCFRWVMFNSKEVQEHSSYNEPEAPVAFIKEHSEITDVLFTGADPLVLKAATLKKYIEPILAIDSVKVIRISSKALGWWPYRFTTDADAQELLELFEYIQSRGKHFNFCAHFTHVKELESKEVQKAIENIQKTGAIIRCQGPIAKEINDTAEDWIALWTKQIMLGMIPYYMFVEADHNPENCFRIPLYKALTIFQTAQKNTTGLARTVRGPVFMNDLNRVLLDGTTEMNGEKYFVLKSLQSPPNTQSEGKIKLIPFDETTDDAGNLFELFN